MKDNGSKAERIKAMLDEGRTVREIGATMGTSRRYVRKVRQALGGFKEAVNPPLSHDYSDKVKSSYSGDSGSVEVNSVTINTLVQALEVAKVDLEKWEVDHWSSIAGRSF